MKPLDAELYLRESGELSPVELRELERRLAADPELAARAEEIAVLQRAGRFASDHTVPPLPELVLERILQSAPRPVSRLRPALWAAAAALALAVGLWPHLRGPDEVQPGPETFVRMESTTVLEADPILDKLEVLSEHLAYWTEVRLDDSWALGNEEDWAEGLLSREDSI